MIKVMALMSNDGGVDEDDDDVMMAVMTMR